MSPSFCKSFAVAMGFLVALGCQRAAPTAPGAATNGPGAQSSPADPPIVFKSPAFESPDAAVKAWHAAYRKDGYDGHVRTTFNASTLPQENIEKTLKDRYAEWTEVDEVRILETIVREPYGAAVCRGGSRV